MRRTGEIRQVRIGGEVEGCIYTTEIQRRMGVQVSGEMLRALGFDPVVEEKTRILWRESDYPQMCYTLAAYIAGRWSA